MKIFLSWSGKRSQAVAELINDWLKCVIQASQPWISTRDIDRGAMWSSEINDKLKDVSVGIVCLTQANKDKPWILFETGALAKGLTTNRVCTFLIDLDDTDLVGPLTQFNHTIFERNSVWELARTINDCLDEKALDDRILQQVFDTYWPQFEKDFQKAVVDNQPDEVVEPRPEKDILSEILNQTRSLSRRMRDLESNTDRKFTGGNSSDDLEPENHMIFRSNSIQSFGSKGERQIKEMVKSGKFTENQIVNSLIDYDMPEKFIREMIHLYKTKGNLKGKIGTAHSA